MGHTLSFEKGVFFVWQFCCDCFEFLLRDAVLLSCAACDFAIANATALLGRVCGLVDFLQNFCGASFNAERARELH